MLIDMIHDNHGEPPFKTRYRDPRVLKAMGYEAIVIPDAMAALRRTYAGVDPLSERSRATETGGGLMPRPPREYENSIDEQLSAAREAGMQVFFYGDALLLPRIVVDKKPSDFCCDDGSGRLCPAKPAVYEALAELVADLFERWPDAAGLVMRTGEVYPEATPHMTGSPLHGIGSGNCERCREMAIPDRLVRFISTMHQVVCEDFKKLYVHRAWQAGQRVVTESGLPNMHDDPRVYRDVSSRVPSSDRLVFSFKFTRGDFRQNAAAGESPFNPCLLVRDRPQWIEFQCEREYEGKGALPNYQAPSWREFFNFLRSADRPAGLSAEDLRSRYGIWGWSRGGGWGGPYVQREEWIDANVQALAALYAQPDADVAELATAWVANAFAVAESAPPAPAITELLLLSAATIRRLLYVSAMADGRHRNGDIAWLRDDVLDVEAVFATAEQVVAAGVAAEAVAEKREALSGVDRIRHLFDLAAAELPNRSQARDLANALSYFHSFAATVIELFIGFVRHAEWLRSGRLDAALAEAVKEHLEAAQGHWQLHTQRHAQLPGAPSMFHEVGLWERTNNCLAQVEEE